MDLFLTLPPGLAVLHLIIIVWVFVRQVMARPAPGIALAWLLIVTLLPIAGIVLYLLFGERRTGRKRAERYAFHRENSKEWIEGILAEEGSRVDWSESERDYRGIDRLGRASVGIPAIAGNSLELLDDTEQILRAIIADIDQATESIHMSFYIWHPGGTADEVVEAVIRAAERGVLCRILVDALGSGEWLRSDLPGRLRDKDVAVEAALTVHPLTTFYRRGDLRYHRKIVVIDGATVYTGSMNLVDPRFFKQDSDVGQWIDAMVRIRGRVAEALFGVFLSDWSLETQTGIRELTENSGIEHEPSRGPADIQVTPSGPGQGTSPDGILQMLVKLIYTAKEEIVLTTPYFVPDESMLLALRGAASQGVRVDLIVPARVDSFFVRHASRSYYDELMEAGVSIQEFDGGLLHTKSITVDGRVSMFGTVNLDMRSLWLNYEVTLFIYNASATRALRNLQERYLEQCRQVDPDVWRERPASRRLLENTVRLASPLL